MSNHYGENEMLIEEFMAGIKKSITPSDEKLEFTYLKQNIEAFYKISKKNKVDSILFPVVAGLGTDEDDPKIIGFINKWKKNTIIKLGYEKRKEQAIEQLMKEANKEGIKLVVFKGRVLAELYPNPLLRSSGDTDIFVYREDCNTAIKILERLGYMKDIDHSKTAVPVYINKKMCHIIELHFNLWEDYSGPRIAELEDIRLTDKEKLVKNQINGVDYYTLGHEEHLIFQIFHIMKHFTLENVELKCLTDLTIFVNHYGKEIDFNSFWNKINKLGYSTFTYSLFEICSFYLGMDHSIMDVAGQIVRADKDKLLHHILFCNKEEQIVAWQILGLMTPYLEGKSMLPDNSFLQKLKLIFQSPEELPEKCNYAKKYPALIGIAWVHKMVDFLFRYVKHHILGREKLEGSIYSPKEKLNVAKQRLVLLNEYGLLKKTK